MAFGNHRKHSKPGQTTVRAFHFRLELTGSQARTLHDALDLGWGLRNELALLLEEDRKAQRLVRQAGGQPEYIGALALKRRVAAKEVAPPYRALHSQVRQDLANRVSEGMNRFFGALKEGRPGVRPPRALDRKHFRSLTYPQYGTAAFIKGARLHLSKLGDFKVTGWRRMRGKKKSITLKFKEGHFWAVVLCEVQACDVARPYSTVGHLPETGMDPGVACVLTDALGVGYDTPKPLKAARARLRRAQRTLSRKFEHRKRAHKGPGALKEAPRSNRLQRAIVKVAKAHTKVERVREDTARKVARRIERTYSRVAVEEHGLLFLMRNRRLARASADVAIGKQKQALRSALGPGRYFEAANRRPGIGGNSQTCLCGAAVPKALSQRWHSCPECGLQGPRDQVSAVICQYETFGSVPDAAASGLGALEHSIQMLKTRRGARKGASGESRCAGSLGTEERAVKRPTPPAAAKRKSTGAKAKVPDKTAGHASECSPLAG